MAKRYGDYSLDEIYQALIQVESSGGKDKRSRYEPGFQRRYLQGKEPWESLAKKYGWQAVSSSYGPAQIMFPVAVEMGFHGSPEELADEAINRQFFEKKFDKDFQRTGGDIRKTLLRYNGGGNPAYPDKVMRHLPKKKVSALPQGGGSMNLENVMFEVDRGLRKRGYPALDAPTLKEMHARMQTPEVLQGLQSGQLTPQYIIDQAVQAIQTMRTGGQQVPASPRPALTMPYDEIINPNESLPGDAGLRSGLLQSHSRTPNYGPIGTPGAAQGNKFLAMNPVYDEQAVLRELRALYPRSI